MTDLSKQKVLDETATLANTLLGGFHQFYRQGFCQALALLETAIQSGSLDAAPVVQEDGLLPCPLCKDMDLKHEATSAASCMRLCAKDGKHPIPEYYLHLAHIIDALVQNTRANTGGDGWVPVSERLPTDAEMKQTTKFGYEWWQVLSCMHDGRLDAMGWSSPSALRDHLQNCASHWKPLIPPAKGARS